MGPIRPVRAQAGRKVWAAVAADTANYITGSELVIDGGITGGAIARSGPLAAEPDACPTGSRRRRAEPA